MGDVITGEAVPLELRLAKLPSRALAFLLDAAVFAIVALGFVLAVSWIIPDVDEALASAVMIAVAVLVLVVLPASIETMTRGRSIGKRVMGLRVVRDDGGPISMRHALVRALAGVFADFVVTLGLGAMVCSLLNSRDKRLGDLMAGTIVVRERIPVVMTTPPVIDPQLADWAQTLELSRLSDGLALAARTLIARAPQLDPAIRDRLTTELAAHITAVVSPAPPPGTPAWIYLSTLLAERRRRESLRYAADAGQPAPDAAPSPPSPEPEPFHADGDGFAPPR
jgi:uncharacterized RDD family membrane protein YckC